MRVTLLPLFLFVFAFSLPWLVPRAACADLVETPQAALDEGDAATQQDEEEHEKTLSKAERVVYYPITRATLSQLFWAMGAYSTDNDTDVDNFMLLNRCGLYKDYYRDDFEWHKIRVKAKASLEKNIKNFPTRFKLIQPLWLKRYDFKTSSFPLAAPFHTSRFEYEALDKDDWECKKYAPSKRVWKYPAYGVVTFSTPLEVTAIEADPETARMYNELYSNVSLHNSRPAYIVIYFKVYEADPLPDKRGFSSKVAQISAVVEKVEFYADLDLKLPLSTLDYRRRNESRFSGSALDKKDSE